MKKHIRMNEVLSDKSVTLKEEDKFQRYTFSQRIADSIVERKNEDCVAIGIYGAWGEGKTSVLNFIKNELSKDETITVINFNPWRYNNEDILLFHFFNKIALAFDKKLKSKGERIADFVSDYTPLGGLLGVDMTDSVKKWAYADIEEYKLRIEKILREVNQKLVIVIDDIDRLDRDEIFNVFKLVKLTGNFLRTTYILAFDYEMIASAIGGRFGEGSQSSGFNFLEKIIQVPLRIPKAQISDLKNECFALINQVFEGLGMKLSDIEAKRFASSFDKYFLKELSTPRLAIRYANSISFALALLKNEVNHVDLLLIEAIKIFYPNVYTFINRNPEYFIGARRIKFISTSEKEKNKDWEKFLTNPENEIPESRRVIINDLLANLFPFVSNTSFSSAGETVWFQQKKIASRNYFNRYFSYAVLKGEISDVDFDDFINSLENLNNSKVIENIEYLIENSDPNTVMYKIKSIEEGLNYKQASKIAEAILTNSDWFPISGNSFLMGYDGAKSQAALFIADIIKKYKDKGAFEFAKSAMEKAIPFAFAYDINNWIRYNNNKLTEPYTELEFKELAFVLIERTKKEAGKEPVYLLFDEEKYYLFSVWNKYEEESLRNYINSFIKENPERLKEFIFSFTPTMRSSIFPNPYKSNFRKEEYDFIDNIIGVDTVYLMIKKHLKSEISKEKVRFLTHNDNNQTAINSVRQFISLYEKLKSIDSGEEE